MTVSETPEDVLIKKVAGLLPGIDTEGILELPEANLIDSLSPKLIRKAWWCYQFVSRLNGGDAIPYDDFVKGYLNAWGEFFLEAAKAMSEEPCRLDWKSPQIMLTYHFPEYPALKKINASPIVKRIAPWMGQGRCILLDDTLIARKIITILKNGGSIIAMLDYAYDSTRNCMVDFLGVPSRTPIGIFEIASRLSMKVGLLSPVQKGKGFEIIEYAPSLYQNSMELACDVMADLTSTIMKEPYRWLLWPNLNHRWPNGIC